MILACRTSDGLKRATSIGREMRPEYGGIIRTAPVRTLWCYIQLRAVDAALLVDDADSLPTVLL